MLPCLIEGFKQTVDLAYKFIGSLNYILLKLIKRGMCVSKG